MYEELRCLQPSGIPLLDSLDPLSRAAVEEIANTHPGIPQDYLAYLSEIGAGQWKDECGFQPYDFPARPENAATDHFKDMLIFENDDDNPAAKGNVWLFAYDTLGEAYGFDSGDSWRLVHIDSCRSVTRLDLSFEQFVRGLLVCFPVTPVRYAESQWFDATGEAYQDGSKVLHPHHGRGA